MAKPNKTRLINRFKRWYKRWSKQPAKPKGPTISLVFDDQASADRFIGWWLDGGGEQQAELNTDYEESDKWDKHLPKWLRVKEHTNEELAD